MGPDGEMAELCAIAMEVQSNMKKRQARAVRKAGFRALRRGCIATLRAENARLHVALRKEEALKLFTQGELRDFQMKTLPVLRDVAEKLRLSMVVREDAMERLRVIQLTFSDHVLMLSELEGKSRYFIVEGMVSGLMDYIGEGKRECGTRKILR